MAGLDIAFFGSSLVSAYRNGAATYYRGILRALAGRGHRITFYEPDAGDRQRHRDMADPPWARVVVYPATEDGMHRALADAQDADVVVKASGVGVFDDELAAALLDAGRPDGLAVYWVVDAPATLAAIGADPLARLRPLLPMYDLVFTDGGGPPAVRAFTALGAQVCVPVYYAHDPDTHHPVAADPRFAADLSFLGNRLPDREERVDRFLFGAARHLPDRRVLLGGSGWEGAPMPPNITPLGHVYTTDHNALNGSATAILNINRSPMAEMGYSPAARVFEAAAAGACVITDSWTGIDHFLEPGEEILVAEDGAAVAGHLDALTPERARRIGEAARRRVLAHHTYDHRAVLVEALLSGATVASLGLTGGG